MNETILITGTEVIEFACSSIAFSDKIGLVVGTAIVCAIVYAMFGLLSAYGRIAL
jgi:hypothetical protein